MNREVYEQRAIASDHAPLELQPAVRDWFGRAFEEPTGAQALAWPAIARGENVLLSAPTGSGKTLAAFLWALDRLLQEGPAPGGGTASCT